MADSAPDPRSTEGSMSLLELINVLLRERRLALAVTMIVAILVVGWVLLQDRTYTSRAAFLPDASSSGAGLMAGGLASQLGLRNMTSGPGPEFYGSLLVSRPVLEQAVETTYSVRTDSGTVEVTLLDVYAKDSDGPRQRRLEQTVREFRQNVDIDVNRATGILEMGVTTEDPELAQSVAARLVELVNESDSRRRRSEASEDMRFLGTRLEEAQEELLAAESELERFLSQNRRINNSPELSFQRDRLQRTVGMRQGVYNSLAETYESARIEQARTTPVITIIAPPQVPALPDARGLVTKAALALLAGLLLGIVAAVTRERIRRARDEDADSFERFRSLRAEAFEDLRNPLRLLPGRSRPRIPAGGTDRPDGPSGPA